MAEAFATIGLASSIVAFVDFAQKVVSRLNEFSNDFRDGTNALTQIQTQLPVIIEGLRKIRARADTRQLDDQAKAALQPIVLACHRQIELLSETLDRVLPAADASKWERRKKAIQSLTTDGKVKNTSEILSQHLHTLTFYHSIGEPDPEFVAKKIYWLVSFDRNSAFVGRETLFNEIEETFRVPEGTQPKVALYGLGGIGKSQIALKYCFRKRSQQPTCSVFWVNAATVARFEESYQRMAKQFGLNDRDDPQKDTLVSVKNWLETDKLQSWIMVIDNVDDETAFFREKCHNDKTPSQIIPHSPHGWLLFTSRTRDVAFDLANPATPISVESLKREEGLELLRQRLGSDPPEADLIELLSELGHIPLAVTQAISFIVKRRKSVEQYLQLYRMSDNSRSRLLKHEFFDHGRQEQTMESVARTWQISFEWIRKHHEKAAEILCLMGFYQHHGVPEQLLRSDDDDILDFEDSIAVLQAFSLLDVDKAINSYSTHRLIQVTTKLWIEQNGPAQLEKWALHALELIASRFPTPHGAPPNDYWDNCRCLLPHADSLLQTQFNGAKREADLVKAELLLGTARYISWERDNVGDIQRRCERSFQIRQNQLGLQHPDTLRSMGFHFWSLNRRDSHSSPGFDGQRTAAIGQTLLELRREVLGPSHRDTIDSLSEFASFLAKREEYAKSQIMQQEALEMSKEVNGPHHHRTLKYMSLLADLLHQMMEYEDAVDLATEALSVSTKLLGPEHRSLIVGKSNLALYLGDAGRVDEAVRMSKEVLTLSERVRGPDHPGTLTGAWNLAVLLGDEQRHEEALDVLGHALRASKDSRRAYPSSIKRQELIDLKLEYEGVLASEWKGNRHSILPPLF